MGANSDDDGFATIMRIKNFLFVLFLRNLVTPFRFPSFQVQFSQLKYITKPVETIQKKTKALPS